MTTDLVIAPISAPSPGEWQALREQAATIARSGLAPSGMNADKIAVIALKGRELAIPPMQALSHIAVIGGKPTLTAELMGALVRRAGHRIRIIETTDQRCEVHGIRHDDPDHTAVVTWDLDRATQAGLLPTNRGPWKNYPAAMLRSRAVSELCRGTFDDVLMGASYTPEELGADVTVGDDGTIEVLDVTRDPQPAASPPTLDDHLDGFDPAWVDANADRLDDVRTWIADSEQGTPTDRLEQALSKLTAAHDEWTATRDPHHVDDVVVDEPDDDPPAPTPDQQSSATTSDPQVHEVYAKHRTWRRRGPVAVALSDEWLAHHDTTLVARLSPDALAAYDVQLDAWDHDAADGRLDLDGDA